MRAPFDPYGAASPAIDQQLGDAFQVIRFVARHIPEIASVAYHMEALYSLASAGGKANADLLGLPSNALNLGDFEGEILLSNLSVKAAIQIIATYVEALKEEVDTNFGNLGQFTGNTIPDNVNLHQALQSLETAIERVFTEAPVLSTEEQAELGEDNTTIMSPLRTKQAIAAQVGAVKANASALGISADATDMGSYDGNILPDNQTLKQNLQTLVTELGNLVLLSSDKGARKYPEHFGYADGTDAENNAAMQEWAAYARAGNPVGLGPRVYEFTAKLDLTTVAAAASILGVGSDSSILRYVGPATSDNLLTVGGLGPTQTVQGGYASGFQIQTETVLLAGSAALHWQHVTDGSVIFDVSPDKRSYRQQAPFRLYHGVTFQNCNITDYTVFLIGYLQGDGIQVYGKPIDGDPDTYDHTGSDLALDFGTIVGCAQAGLHCGGGFGGLYVGKILCFGNRKNYRITNELAANYNREIMLRSDSVSDGGYVYGIEINDPLVVGGNIHIAGFVGSSGLDPTTGLPRPEPEYAGDNIKVKAWNGVITITSPKVFNAKLNGISVDDPNAQVHISEATVLQTNGLGGLGFGVWFQDPNNPTAHTSNIKIKCEFGKGSLANTSGRFNSLIDVLDWHSQPTTIGTGGGGPLTSYQAYTRWAMLPGEIMVFQTYIDLTDIGPATGSLVVYLPFNSPTEYVVTGMNKSSGAALVGVSLHDLGNPGAFNLFAAGGGFPGANGQRLLIGGTIQVITNGANM